MKHKLHRILVAILISALSLASPAGRSQLSALPALAGSADTCRNKVDYELAKEQRLFRAYLFGKHNAANASIGEVRYDVDGWAWIKDSLNVWINSHPDNQGLIWTDVTMDRQYEHSRIVPLRGIFETKRVTTSELIPYILQSMRAMDCRLKTLCEVARYSEIQNGDKPLEMGSVRPAGCIEFTDLTTWPECHFGHPSQGIADQADTRSYCDEVSNQLLLREAELVKLAVEYDAGFRTLLQFAGNFDIFLREMRLPLTGTVRQAAQLLGQLQRIPCFISSCDSAPAQIE